jgi:hypothetical protein
MAIKCDLNSLKMCLQTWIIKPAEEALNTDFSLSYLMIFTAVPLIYESVG